MWVLTLIVVLAVLAGLVAVVASGRRRRWPGDRDTGRTAPTDGTER
jgi:hypothetical protein